VYQPKTLVESTWRDSAMELSALYVVTTVGAAHLLSMHWLLALLLAPVIMGTALLGVIAAVHLLWLLVSGLDRLGAALGIRKSPLA